MATPFSDKFKKEVADAYAAGLSPQAVATQFGLTRQTVAYIAKKAGVIRCRKTPQALIAKIRELYEVGLTSGEVARQVGLSSVSVNKIARKNGFGRSHGEASRVFCASAKGRQAIAKMRAISTAMRSASGVSPTEKEKRSRTRMADKKHVGLGERILADLLVERGLTVSTQHACLGYNIDIAVLPDVAVEVCFQRFGRILTEYAARTCALQSEGWHVCYVHGDVRRQDGKTLDTSVADFVQKFAQHSDELPPGWRAFAVVTTRGVVRTYVSYRVPQSRPSV